jgi:hypothetical protein
MEEVLIPLGLFAAVAGIVYIVVSRRHEEKMELITQGLDPLGIPAPTSLLGSQSLLWGLVSLALGLSAFIYFLIMGEVEEPELLYCAISAVVIGLACIAYHKLTKAQRAWGMRLYEKKVDSLKS